MPPASGRTPRTTTRPPYSSKEAWLAEWLTPPPPVRALTEAASGKRANGVLA